MTGQISDKNCDSFNIQNNIIELASHALYSIINFKKLKIIIYCNAYSI